MLEINYSWIDSKIINLNIIINSTSHKIINFEFMLNKLQFLMKNFKFNHNWTFWKLIENHAMSHQAKTETERATSERTLISMTDASLAHTAEVEPPK